MKRSLLLVGAFVAATFMGLAGPVPAAATSAFYFHGTAADQANKIAGSPTATFSSGPTTGSTPVTQTTSPAANRDFAGNPLAAYWTGAFTGTLSGDLQLDWWWSTTNATAQLLGLSMDVAVFGDPDSSGNGTLLGRATVNLTVTPAPTENTSQVPVGGSVAKTLLIQAVPHFDDTGQGAVVYYDATSTPSGFSFVKAPTSPAVTFDTTTPISMRQLVYDPTAKTLTLDANWNTEDNLNCVLTFPTGYAHTYLTWTAGVRKVIYSLQGTRGALVIDDDDWELTSDGKVEKL